MNEGPLDELPEGAEAASQEFQDAVNAAQKERMSKILDKAAEDPQWKQQFLDDPEAALASIGESGPPDVGEVGGQYHWRTKWVYGYGWAGWGWYHWRW